MAQERAAHALPLMAGVHHQQAQESRLSLGRGHGQRTPHDRIPRHRDEHSRRIEDRMG